MFIRNFKAKNFRKATYGFMSARMFLHKWFFPHTAVRIGTTLGALKIHGGLLSYFGFRLLWVLREVESEVVAWIILAQNEVHWVLFMNTIV
jgi:hypothetical protein